MKHAPRPAARVLLAGRFAVARSALVARPAGPVNGIDLARGAAVVLELRAGAARPPGAEAWRHRGGWVLATEPLREVPPPPAQVEQPACVRPPRLGALRGELGTRRVRLTVLAAAGVAGVLLVGGLLGGSRPGSAETARAASPPVAPVSASARRVAADRPTRHPSVPAVATVRATARGGAARVLVAAPRARPRPPGRPTVRPVRRTVVRRSAPVRSTGWVAGLFVGG